MLVGRIHADLFEFYRLHVGFEISERLGGFYNDEGYNGSPECIRLGCRI